MPIAMAPIADILALPSSDPYASKASGECANNDNDNDNDEAMTAGTTSLVDILDCLADTGRANAVHDPGNTGRKASRRVKLLSAGAKLTSWSIFRTGAALRMPIADPNTPEEQRWAIQGTEDVKRHRLAGELSCRVTFIPYALQTTALPTAVEPSAGTGTGTAESFASGGSGGHSGSASHPPPPVEFRCQWLGTFGRLHVQLSTSAVAV